MYTIGSFSNLCDVPVKTIRYYSDIGLLEPSYVDPETSYRYYDYDKMKELKIILVLKDCQFSLNEIGQVLKGEDMKILGVRLKKKTDELKDQLEQITKQINNVQQIERFIKNDEAFVPEPTLSSCYIEKRQDTQVLSIRKTINIVEMDTLVKKLFERLYAYQFEMDGELLAIFHQKDWKQKKADVELLLPVKVDENEELLMTLPGGMYACVNVKGPYSELHYAYNCLKAWLAEQSLHVEGMYMEQYIKGLVPSKVANPINIKPNNEIHPNDFLTKVFVKIR
ncbi:MerR family transcriptional regulator [Viridibacillus soli]|nr:MerR family transcriptional regulator [Viridibacillus soli]